VVPHILLANQVWTWIIILAVVLLLFGATRLPALAKSLGQSARVLRKELKSDETDGTSASAPAQPTASASAPAESEQPSDKK
jgi:sec-independent protein translocase protein TatA